MQLKKHKHMLKIYLPKMGTPCLWAAFTQAGGGIVMKWWLKYTKMSTQDQLKNK